MIHCYPWRCLCLASLQIILTLPCLFRILQFHSNEDNRNVPLPDDEITVASSNNDDRMTVGSSNNDDSSICDSSRASTTVLGSKVDDMTIQDDINSLSDEDSSSSEKYDKNNCIL